MINGLPRNSDSFLDRPFRPCIVASRRVSPILTSPGVSANATDIVPEAQSSNAEKISFTICRKLPVWSPKRNRLGSIILKAKVDASRCFPCHAPCKEKRKARAKAHNLIPIPLSPGGTLPDTTLQPHPRPLLGLAPPLASLAAAPASQRPPWFFPAAPLQTAAASPWSRPACARLAALGRRLPQCARTCRGPV